MTLPCSTVELRVYDRDGVTLRDTVSGTGLQWADPLGECGSAELSVPLVQAIMQTDPALLTNGIIKVATDLTPGDPLVEIFGFLAEGGTFALITEKEKAGEERSLQCRGLLGLFDDWVVYPETGIHAHSGDQRAFGWMSAESTHWYDEAQWSGTISGTRWKDIGATSDRYQQPKHWPDPKAYWIGCNSKEKQYLRTTLTVAEDTPVRIYASADENLRVYLDSELIISNNSNEVGYTELNHWRGLLTAGEHTIGVRYLKTLTWALGGWDMTDADRMILTVCSLNPDGTVKDVLRRSNLTSWLGVGLDDGTRPPTWSAAGIVGKLVQEARARGVQSADRISMGSFDQSTDSDGTAWPDLHERSWPIGTKGSQILSDLGELDVDFDMLPDLQLHAYVDQGSDVSATVALVQGVNILSYKIDDTPIISTTLLVRCHNRWVERADSVSEAVNDRREGFLETGGSLSREHARHVADRALDDLARERKTATAVIIATTGCVPYLDFGKGDTVMAYDATLTAAPMRIVSISGALPDDGPVRWTLELEEP